MTRRLPLLQQQILDKEAEVVITREGSALNVTGGGKEVKRFIDNNCRFCQGNDGQVMNIEGRKDGVSRFGCMPAGRRVVNQHCAGE